MRVLIYILNGYVLLFYTFFILYKDKIKIETNFFLIFYNSKNEIELKLILAMLFILIIQFVFISVISWVILEENFFKWLNRLFIYILLYFLIFLLLILYKTYTILIPYTIDNFIDTIYYDNSTTVTYIYTKDELFSQIPTFYKKMGGMKLNLWFDEQVNILGNAKTAKEVKENIATIIKNEQEIALMTHKYMVGANILFWLGMWTLLLGSFILLVTIDIEDD